MALFIMEVEYAIPSYVLDSIQARSSDMVLHHSRLHGFDMLA